MTQRLPFYVELDNAGVAEQLTEFQPDDVVPQSAGGTGSTSLAPAIQDEITAQGLPTTQDLTNLQTLIPTQAGDINAIPQSEKGLAGGVPSLDVNSKIPLVFLPTQFITTDTGVDTHSDSTTALTKLTITLPATLTNGDYLVVVSYGFNSDSTTRDFIAWLEKDGVRQGQRHRVEPKDTAANPNEIPGTGSNQSSVASRRWLFSLSGGETLDYLFTTSSNGIRASMYDAMMTIERVNS